MPYCSRCGELCRFKRCHKCGSSVSSPATPVRTPVIDRWQSRYLDSGSDPDQLALNIKLTESRTPSSRRPSFSSLLESKRVAPSTSAPSSSTCAECHQPLRGKAVRLPDSQTRYHWACLQCAQCKQPFENTSFSVDDFHRFYHPQCAPVTYSQSCSRCSLPIRDAYLVIHNTPLHAKCFRCASCQKVLGPSTIYVDTGTAAFCQPCAPSQDLEERTKIVPQFQPPPKIKQELITGHDDAEMSRIKPSSLMSRRARPLPKFGAQKTCPGCMQTIGSVHEEKSGPRATRWHIKCLRCAQCSKALDSSAAVIEKDSGGLDPWCTVCLLAKGKK